MNFLRGNKNILNTSRMFKVKFFASLIALLVTTLSFAQQGVNYQGVARDANSELIVNTEINLEFNINKTTIDGATVYTETHTVITDVNGVFSVVIGQGVSVQDFEADINWAEDRHFLNVWLNGQEIGTTEFMAVPFAKAIGKWQAHKNGVTAIGTGGSFYIGSNSGETDDLNDNYNIGIGDNTLKNSTSFHNIAIGNEALMSNESGWNNVAVGPIALTNNTSGNYNLALGVGTMHANVSGSYNMALGAGSLRENISGSRNVAVGRTALRFNDVGNDNIALGYDSMRQNTSGNKNIALGRNALYSNETGDENISLGYEALYLNTVGNSNIALGLEALKNNRSGNDNVSLGRNSLQDNEIGNENIAVGKQAMRDNISGSENTALGNGVLSHNETGDFNTAIGSVALRSNTTGNYNTAIGAGSGFLAEGNHNVFIGLNSGFDVQGDHKLYIENTASDSPLIYGEFDNDIIAFNGKVGIGTHNPNMPLQITDINDVSLELGSGTIVIGEEVGLNIAMDNNEIQARAGGVAGTLHLQLEGGDVAVGGAVVHASDRRLKRDIETISYGLNEILQLRPTEYFWKGKEQEHKSLGLIAQEVDAIIKNVVTYNEEHDRFGVSYTELIPVLIKAIQEQQLIIKSQQKRNNRQSKDLADLKDRMDNLEALLAKVEKEQL